MNELEEYTERLFEDIKHIDENGCEFWYARELQKVLEYKEWRNFSRIISRTKETCKNSKINTNEQFVEVNKLSKRNNNAYVNIQDYKLSRYICYLIVQNADSSKEIIALGQTYFAIQTRRQELSEKEYSSDKDITKYNIENVKEIIGLNMLDTGNVTDTTDMFRRTHSKKI